jgi:hypothetical protein
MKVYLLYTTDIWHSRSSMRLEGIFTSDDSLHVGLRRLLEIDGKSEDEIEEILDELFDSSYMQTQGYDTNYMVEDYETDELINV